MVTQAKKTGGTSLNIVEDIVLNKDCDAALSTIRSNAVEMNKIEHKLETKTQGSDMAQTLIF